MIPGTVFGFSSTTYTVTETTGVVAVCVEVFNPLSGEATQPFNVTSSQRLGRILHCQCSHVICVPEISDLQQQKVKCNTELGFDKGTTIKCADYQDDVCSIKKNTVSTELVLSLPVSSDTLGVCLRYCFYNVSVRTHRHTHLARR